MQRFKYSILISLTFLCFSLSEAQEFVGNYQLMYSEMSFIEIGITYTFYSDGTFNNITHKHLGEKTISEGNYLITNDTLILNYKDSNKNILSTSKLIKKRKLNSQDRFFSKVQIFNSNGNPQVGFNLILQTKEKNNIAAFSSDEEGKFPPLSIYDCYVEYLNFSFIGYKSISINTDTLFGYDTEIKVNLEESSETYSNHEGTYKFIIKNLNSKGMELLALNNQKEKIKLKRID